jgi:hypothetical protein
LKLWLFQKTKVQNEIAIGGLIMVAWILGKVKWLLLLAAVGGPVMAYFGYTSANEMKEVMAQGTEAVATIDGGTIRKGRRSGTSFSINLAWTDKSGVKQTAEKVSISSALADKLIVGDKIVRDSVKIKYLPGATETKPVILEDAARQISSSEDMVPVMIGAGVIGAIGSGFFLMRRRREAAA